MTDTELMAGFCSLGVNCEFGVAQRKYGAEPIDLFRWTSTGMPALLALLAARFESIGDDLEVLPCAPGGEYMMQNNRYRFRWHAWLKYGEMEPDAILAREKTRLPFLGRKLIEELTEGRRIFVRTPAPWELHDKGLPELLRLLREYGPVTLLYVCLADADHPAGLVVTESGGLLRGYLDHFADPAEVAGTTPSADWLALCRDARALTLTGVE
jgi:hypothetical protein